MARRASQIEAEVRYRRKVRQAVLAFLGGKCSNIECRWLNADGTFRCTDSDLLHVDHVNDDGYEDRKTVNNSVEMYRKVLKDTRGRYQLLCSNCNWKKRANVAV